MLTNRLWCSDARNLLYDPDLGRVTGLIDYDFATILHLSYEFPRSFYGAGGQFRGWYVDEESDEAALRHAKLYEFPSPLPPTKTAGGDGAAPVNWEDAKAWEDALEEVGAQRPRTMRGIDKVADVDTVLQTILPWRVTNSDVLSCRRTRRSCSAGTTRRSTWTSFSAGWVTRRWCVGAVSYDADRVW
jgi:hypothetical protein